MVPIHDAMRKAPSAPSVRSAVFSGGTAHHICDVAGTPRHLLTRAALERALRNLLRKRSRKIAKKYDLAPQRIPLLISGAVILAAILDHGWLMNGSQITSSGYLPNVGNLNWQIVGVSDFNGDGKAEILWHNLLTGEDYLWLMNCLSVLNNGPLPTIADQHWQIAGVADFNNDGKADILWHNVDTGENFMWLMNGLSIASSVTLPQIADLNWQISGVGKFNGSANGAGIPWRRSGTSIASSGPLPTIADLSSNIVGVGDFDGDGIADILWRNGSTGDTYIWLMNGLTLSSASSLPAVSLSWQLP